MIIWGTIFQELLSKYVEDIKPHYNIPVSVITVLFLYDIDKQKT